MKTTIRKHRPLSIAFALLLTLMVVLVLAACGSKSTNAINTSTPSATESTVPAPTPGNAEGDLAPHDSGRGDKDNTEAGDRADTPEWNGYDLGQNIEYVEDYKIEGDSGDGFSPREAAKVLVDGTLIELYGMEFPIHITLVGIDRVEGEECYIFEVSTQFDEERHQGRYGVGHQGAVFELDNGAHE